MTTDCADSWEEKGIIVLQVMDFFGDLTHISLLAPLVFLVTFLWMWLHFASLCEEDYEKMDICEVTKLMVIMAEIGWVPGEIVGQPLKPQQCPGMIEIVWVLGPI